MKNKSLQAGLVPGGVLYLGRLVGGLLVCGLMSVCSEKFSVFRFLFSVEQPIRAVLSVGCVLRTMSLWP
jgi:hypothetical protein